MRSTDEGTPQLTIEAGIATIRLRRPSQRNSLRDADLHALLEQLATVDADASVRVLVLRAELAAAGRPVFCAGYDVGGFDAGSHGPQLFERVPDAIEALRPITVCALNGSVYGGATDLVLACDLRLAVAGAEFRMPAAALGLHYYPSGLRRYVSRLGLDLAKRAFLTAQPIAVETLAAAGVFTQVVESSAFDAACEQLVQQAAALAPWAAQATKRSLDEIARGDFDARRLREREAASLASADFADGRAALAQRRPPRFSGR
jgi:enoyl-CoA hydratase/carnithine racemase